MKMIDDIITSERRIVLDLDRYDLALLIQIIGEQLASTAVRKPVVSIMVTEYINGTSETSLFINDAHFGMATERIENLREQ